MSELNHPYRDLAASNLIFFQDFYDMLNADPAPGYFSLVIDDCDHCTQLFYDTDDKYLINDQDLTSNAPTRYYRGAAAETLWILLENAGYYQRPVLVEQTSNDYAARQKNIATLRGRLANGQAGIARNAKLEPEDLTKLFDYMREQVIALSKVLAGIDQEAACDSTSQKSESKQWLISPHAIFDRTTTLMRSLNNQIESELEYRLNWLRDHHEALRMSSREDVMADIKWHIFSDMVRVSTVTEEFFRPLQFTGLQIDLPTDELEPMRIDIVFADARADYAQDYVAGHTSWTKELCLSLGLQELLLSADYRQWVLKYGELCPSNPTSYYLDSTLLSYAKTRVEATPRPVTVLAGGDDDDDLPF